MTERELLKLIAQGEGTKLEFKSWIKCHDNKERRTLAAKSAVALANAAGGVFLFGVEDDGQITGCPNAEPQTVMESIYDMTRPNLFTGAEDVQTEHGTVLAVTVEKSAFPVATSAGTYYKRLGKTSKPYYPNSVLSSAPEMLDFSAKIVSGASINDIDLLEVYKLKEKLRVRDKGSVLPDESDLTFLDNLELIRTDGGEVQITVAGLLFAGKEQAVRKHLPQAEVIYLHYGDSNQQEYDNRIDLQKPLVTVLDTLTEQIRMHNRLTNVQIGLFRMEIYDFAEAVFQEALLNALTHRSYEHGGAVYVKHYPDKIVIESPGNFPEGITVDNIITHQSVPRNKLIAMTLQRLKYVQRSGQGVDIMYQRMLVDGKPYPEYIVHLDAIRLVLHSTMENETFLRFVVEEQERNQREFSLSKLMLLRYLTDHKKMTVARGAKLIQDSVDTAHTNLEELRALGLVEPSGREYMLTARVYEMLKKEVNYVQDKTVQQVKARARILDYLETKSDIGRATVQELCGYSEDQAYYLLNKMYTEGKLERIGKGRATKYRLPTK